MFENAAVGIGLMNLDRKILECNEAVTQIFGFLPEEFMDRFAFDLIHPDDRGADSDLYQELLDKYPGSIFVPDARKKFRLLRGDASH